MSGSIQAKGELGIQIRLSVIQVAFTMIQDFESISMITDAFSLSTFNALVISCCASIAIPLWAMEWYDYWYWFMPPPRDKLFDEVFRLCANTRGSQHTTQKPSITDTTAPLVTEAAGQSKE
jgi:hypothetical protein